MALVAYVTRIIGQFCNLSQWKLYIDAQNDDDDDDDDDCFTLRILDRGAGWAVKLLWLGDAVYKKDIFGVWSWVKGVRAVRAMPNSNTVVMALVFQASLSNGYRLRIHPRIT